MFKYAQLNKNDICTGFITSSKEIIDDSLISLEIINEDYLWKKYDRVTETWSVEKFKPEINTPLNEFEDMKLQITLMKQALDELLLGGAL